jgi:hypothetical protein
VCSVSRKGGLGHRTSGTVAFTDESGEALSFARGSEAQRVNVPSRTHAIQTDAQPYLPCRTQGAS